MKKEKVLQIITALVINFIIAWPLSYAISLSDINAEATDSSAIISWKTDDHGTSYIYYGKNKNTELSKFNPVKVQEHSIQLSGLDFNTLYYYKVKSCDDQNKCNTSSLESFTTANIPPPVKITGLINTSGTQNSITLTWDKSTSTHLKHHSIYRDNEPIGNVTTITYTDNNLEPSTSYNYQVSAVDTGNNIGEKSDILTVTTKEPDKTAPQISDIKISALTADSATITWTTDEESNATVYYSQDTSLDKFQSISTYSTTHTVKISNLAKEVVYNYKVQSCDVNGNCINSEISQFVPGTDISVPAIEIILPEYHNSESIHITGKTKQFSEVKFYVNGVYAGVLSKSNTGADGIIDINIRGLKQGNNTIKVVATDSYNLKTEKEYSITVDTKPPEYTLSQIPKISKERNLIIEGTVNEPCTIKYYSQVASKGIDSSKKITNFKSDYEKLTPNSITLIWDELENVDYYAIYRTDVGLIGTVNKPPFVDRNANTATTYTYEIAPVFKDCSMGSKVSISATTLEGGNTNIRAPTELKPRCTGITPKGEIEAQDSFTFSLGLNPGLNDIIINITDKAGNSVILKEQIIHDSSAPQIKTTNLNQLSPSYTNQVTIQGTVSEHAVVNVYIDDDEEPSASAETDENGDFSVEVNLRRKVETDYSATQTSAGVRAESLPLWENNIKIIAVDDVGLESNAVTGKIEYQLCGYGGDWQIEVGEATPDILIPRLLLQGVAKVGFNVNLKWQGPGESKNAVITENPKITIRPLNKIDQDKSDEEFFGTTWQRYSSYYRSSYYLIGLKRPYVERDQTTLEMENNLSKHNLGNCLVPGFGCIKLPLMLEIHYTYKEPYGTTTTGTVSEDYSALARTRSQQGLVYGVQRQCFDVEIAIDRRLPIDRLLPKSLLKSIVSGLNQTVSVIDKVLEPVKTVQKFVFAGCAGMWVVWFVYKFKEWTACNKIAQVFENFNPKNCDPNEEGEKGEGCASCLQARAETIKHWEKTTWICDRVICPAAPTVQKYVRDAKSEANRQERLGIPETLQEKSHCEDESVANIDWTISKNDETDSFYRDPANYWLEVRNLEEESNIPGYPNDEYCESEYIRNYDSVAIFMNEFKESFCLTKPSEQEQAEVGINCGGFQTVTRAVRGVCEDSQSEKPQLISSEGKTYLVIEDFPGERGEIKAAYEITKKEQINLIEPTESEKKEYYQVEQPNYIFQTLGAKLGISEEYTGQNIYIRKDKKVMDENDCYMVNGGYSETARWDPNREYIDYDDISTAQSREKIGLDKVQHPNNKWSIANFKSQFCGLQSSNIVNLNFVSESEKIKIGTNEYKRVVEKEDGKIISSKWIITNAVKSETKDTEKKNEDYDDSQFLNIVKQSSDATLFREDGNYKYDSKAGGFLKIGAKTDRTECVNIPRAVWEEVCGDDAKDYAIDPTSDLISAVQSGCLTATSAYLQQYKTVLQMIKACFEQLLYTGEGSSGVCKQVLSVYICDLVYYAIRCIVEKTGKGYGPDKIQPGVFGFLKYMRDSGSSIQNSIRGRYGTSTIYRTMFVERKLIHSACALAFTGDYDLDIDAMLDAQLAVPVKTMCYINGNRRFAYADPASGRATFLYNLGVFMVGGGSAGVLATSLASVRTTTATKSTTPLIKPVTYRVQLVCSNTNNCQSDISETGACDCLTYGGEQTRRSSAGEIIWNIPVGDGTLEQGETLNEEVYYEKAINTPYRFDRARILVSYVDNQGVEHIDEVCGETYLNEVGSKAPAMCRFEITEGFICEFEWGEFVTAYFENVKIKRPTPEVPVTGREELHVGDFIELEGFIRKEGSAEKMEEQRVYLRYKLRTAYYDYLIDKPVEITKRNTDLTSDPELTRNSGYSFPAIKIVNQGPAHKENEETGLIEVNPFLTRVSQNIALQVNPNSFIVDPDITIDRTGMIKDIRISFNKKEDNNLYYFIHEGCEGEKEGIYSDTGVIRCITSNDLNQGEKITIKISGATEDGKWLTIRNAGINTQSSADRRPLYLELSLHTADEWNQQDYTALTYNGRQQILNFDFYVTRTERGVTTPVEEKEQTFTLIKYIEPNNAQEILKQRFGSEEKEVQPHIAEFVLKTKNSEKPLQVNKEIIPILENINTRLENIDYTLGDVGGWVFRPKTEIPDQLSYHAFGLAIDINPDKNPYCKTKTPECTFDLPINLIKAFNEYGFEWGGAWTDPYDPMHFEYRGIFENSPKETIQLPLPS